MTEMSASNILSKAAEIVAGSRNKAHGDAERSFDAIAACWEATLTARKGGRAAPITAVDVAWMMVDLKKCRSYHGNPKEPDHYVDAGGYSGLAGEIALREVPSQPVETEVTSDPLRYAAQNSIRDEESLRIEAHTLGDQLVALAGTDELLRMLPKGFNDGRPTPIAWCSALKLPMLVRDLQARVDELIAEKRKENQEAEVEHIRATTEYVATEVVEEPKEPEAKPEESVEFVNNIAGRFPKPEEKNEESGDEHENFRERAKVTAIRLFNISDKPTVTQAMKRVHDFKFVTINNVPEDKLPALIKELEREIERVQLAKRASKILSGADVGRGMFDS